jgi:hypothetical protein
MRATQVKIAKSKMQANHRRVKRKNYPEDRSLQQYLGEGNLSQT